MTVDLARALKLSPPAGAPQIATASSSRHGPQQTGANPDNPEFVTVLSAMGDDRGSRVERSSIETTGSDSRRSRHGQPEFPSDAAPDDANADPKVVSASVNAPLVNLTWPTLSLTPLQEAAVSQIDDAAKSRPGQVTGDSAGNWRMNMAQRQLAGQTLAPGDERLSVSPASSSPEAHPEQEHGRPPLDAQPPETVQHVTIKSLETHFPLVLSDMPAGRDPTPGDKGRRNARADAALTLQSAENRQQIGALTKASNPESDTALQRESLGRTLASNEERFSTSMSPDPQPIVEATPDRGAPEKAPTSETIQHVPINSLETRFPAVLANMLAERVPGRDDNDPRNVNIHVARSSHIPETGQPSAPTRILTLELEPASLGAVTVRMRMSRSSVDMQIRVDSMDALHALNSARDKLVEAVQSSGCTVDSCTIRVSSAPSSADASQHTASDGSQNMASNGSELSSRANIGQEGARHGARNDTPREAPHTAGERAPNDSKSSRSADRVHGLYL